MPVWPGLFALMFAPELKNANLRMPVGNVVSGEIGWYAPLKRG
jgi:hypothetical protein